MLSNTLPSMEETQKRYDINFSKYAILIYYPVTTEYDSIGKKIKIVVDAILKSGLNYVTIFPNNDWGSELILNEYRCFYDVPNVIRVFPSLRFEHFLMLMKNSEFIIVNSSSVIREADVYGIPTIDIETRQKGRYHLSENPNIQHVDENVNEILEAINRIDAYRKKRIIFGDGHSLNKFLKIIREESFWQTELQKHFVDHDI